MAYRLRRRSNNTTNHSRIEIKRKLGTDSEHSYQTAEQQRVDTEVTGSRVFESSFDRHEREIESEAEKYLEKLRGQK